MNKSILNKSLIIICTFLILQNISNAKETSQNINLAEVNLQDIEVPMIKKKKTKEDYEKEDDLLNPLAQKYEKSDIKKEEDLKLDGGVGVNKESKSIDEVKVNIGTKF